MHISKVILTDNFVPDIATDQFRRRIVGYDVTLSEGEDYKEAEKLADQKIREYIKANTTDNPMAGTLVKFIEEKPELAPVSSFIEAINTSTSLKSVEIFRKLVERENIPELTEAFENKIKSFENK